MASGVDGHKVVRSSEFLSNQLDPRGDHGYAAKEQEGPYAIQLKRFYISIPADF